MICSNVVQNSASTSLSVNTFISVARFILTRAIATWLKARNAIRAEREKSSTLQENKRKVIGITVKHLKIHKFVHQMRLKGGCGAVVACRDIKSKDTHETNQAEKITTIRYGVMLYVYYTHISEPIAHHIV